MPVNNPKYNILTPEIRQYIIDREWEHGEIKQWCIENNYCQPTVSFVRTGRLPISTAYNDSALRLSERLQKEKRRAAAQARCDLRKAQRIENDDQPRLRTKNQTLSEHLANYIVDEQTKCWNIQGKTTPAGYKPICKTVNGKATTLYAHRLQFEHHYGAIPDGFEVMHTCDNPKCINPDHLLAGTHVDNMADQMRKRRRKTQLSIEQQAWIIKNIAKINKIKAGQTRIALKLNVRKDLKQMCGQWLHRDIANKSYSGAFDIGDPDIVRFVMSDGKLDDNMPMSIRKKRLTSGFKDKSGLSLDDIRAIRSTPRSLGMAKVLAEKYAISLDRVYYLRHSGRYKQYD